MAKLGDRIIIGHSGELAEAYLNERLGDEAWRVRGYRLPNFRYNSMYRQLELEKPASQWFDHIKFQTFEYKRTERDSDVRFCNDHFERLTEASINKAINKRFYTCPQCSVGFWQGSGSKPANQIVRTLRRNVFDLLKQKHIVTPSQIESETGIDIAKHGGIGGLNEQECKQIVDELNKTKPALTVVDLGKDVQIGVNFSGIVGPSASNSPYKLLTEDIIAQIAKLSGIPESIIKGNQEFAKTQSKNNSNHQGMGLIQQPPERIREIDLD